MIRYALACDSGHEFESWFPGSADYDAQVARGLVTCPFCDSVRVEKQIMAPSIAKQVGTLPAPSPSPIPAESPNAMASPLPPAQPHPMAVFSEKEREVRAMLRAFREHVTKNADYVGPSFADEARKMHYGETEHRSIYGEANPADARELIDEGIEVHPLPMVPDERN